MATAAPAAPSPSAPASAPAAQPVPVGGPEATPAPAPDKEQRLAKPLRPIPDLPGVFPDDDPFPPPPSRAAAASDPAKPGATALTRGPDGRFAAASSPATTATGEHTQQTSDELPQPSKFKFAGEEYDSQEAAEQNVRSMRGQFRPIQALGRQLGGLDKIAPTLQSAAESARGWKAEAERLRAELDGRAPAPAAADDVPQPGSSPDGGEAGIDWDLYAEIKRLATENGEPWQAEKWLAEQQERVIQTRVNKLLGERLAPLAEAEAHQDVVNRTQDLFGGLAQYTNSDGSPAFPELHDEGAAHEIGKMWVAMGLPPEAALTPQGAIAAVAIYRMAKAGRAASGARPTPSAAIPPPPPAADPSDALAAADLGDGRGRPLGSPALNGPSAEAARIVAGLRQANSGNRALLGFDA